MARAVCSRLPEDTLSITGKPAAAGRFAQSPLLHVTSLLLGTQVADFLLGTNCF